MGGRFLSSPSWTPREVGSGYASSLARSSFCQFQTSAPSDAPPAEIFSRCFGIAPLVATAAQHVWLLKTSLNWDTSVWSEVAHSLFPAGSRALLALCPCPAVSLPRGAGGVCLNAGPSREQWDHAKKEAKYQFDWEQFIQLPILLCLLFFNKRWDLRKSVMNI